MSGAIHPILRYGTAVAAVSLALLFHRFSPALYHDTFLLLVAAVVLTVWLGGQGAGLLAAVLSAVVLAFDPPPDAVSWPTIAGRLLRIGFFCFLAGLISLLGGSRSPSIRSHEEYFRQLAENIEGVFWLVDLRLDELLYVSPSYETLWGRSCASLYANPHSFLDAVHPEDRERVAATMLSDRANERFTEEFRVLRPDGTIRWVNVRSFPILDERGRAYRLAGITVDMTTRKQEEERLAYQAQLLDEVNDAIIATDREHRITSWNRAAERMYGWRAEEVLGAEIRLVILVQLSQRSLEEVLSEVLQRGAWRGEAVHWSRDGRKILVDWSITAVRNLVGELIGTVAITHDVTQLKESQQQVVQAERLAAIGQVVASIAHENGSALQGMRACLERLALRLEKQPALLQLVERAQREQQRLARLYEDVRRYAAPMFLEPRLCSVAEVWRTAWEQLVEQRADRQAELVEETGAVELRCMVDSFRLEQVFRNVFDNALTACPDPVRIVVHCAEEELEGRPALSIAIRDNGPGFSAEQRQRIFEPFYTTRTRGTGLGMAISKRFIAAHSGRITIGSGTDSGAEIIITLPRRGP